MTSQEAKILFEEDLKDGKCNEHCPECNARELAISALKKQIPKRVIHTQNHHQHFCSTCHHPIKVGRKYCGSCGQALKWGEN